MRAKNCIMVAALIAAFTIGCSKSNTQNPEAAARQSALDKLEKQYQDEAKQIQDAQAKLDAMRQSYTTNDAAYLSQSNRLQNMIFRHRIFYQKLQAEKMDAQKYPQGTN